MPNELGDDDWPGGQERPVELYSFRIKDDLLGKDGKPTKKTYVPRYKMSQADAERCFPGRIVERWDATKEVRMVGGSEFRGIERSRGPGPHGIGAVAERHEREKLETGSPMEKVDFGRRIEIILMRKNGIKLSRSRMYDKWNSRQVGYFTFSEGTDISLRRSCMMAQFSRAPDGGADWILYDARLVWMNSKGHFVVTGIERRNTPDGDVENAQSWHVCPEGEMPTTPEGTR